MIETNRLILRPFCDSDLNDLFEYLKEIKINCFMEMKVQTLEEAKVVLDERIKSKNYFAIELKDSHKVIGEIFSEAISTNEFGGEKDNFSPCWILNEKFRNKGYMTEAAKAYINYLFEKENARRIFAYTEDYNIFCQKLLEKLGFRKEGFYKEFVSFVKDENGNPIYENTYEYAILKKEWESKCKEKQK